MFSTQAALLCLLAAGLFLTSCVAAVKIDYDQEEANGMVEEEDKQEGQEACADNYMATQWCQQLDMLTSARHGCNGFFRSMSSSSEKKTIVFKLLENLWHNCPKTCFGCNLHNNPRVPAELISDSEKFRNFVPPPLPLFSSF